MKRGTELDADPDDRNVNKRSRSRKDSSKGLARGKGQGGLATAQTHVEPAVSRVRGAQSKRLKAWSRFLPHMSFVLVASS